MINCNIHNYKEWIGSYIEGNLTREDMLSAESFLQKHPQLLDNYLQELEEFSLIPEEIELDLKNELSISINETPHINSTNFTEYFIGSHEGILDRSQRNELVHFLSINPKLQKEFNLYGSTKLHADNNITYPHKKDLLKKARPAVPLFWSISVAASILLLVSAWIFWPTTGNKSGLVIDGSNHIQLNFSNPGKITQPSNNHALVENKNSINNTVVVQNTKEEKSIARKTSVPVEIQNNQMVDISLPTNDNLAFQTIPQVDEIMNNQLETAGVKPKKKGLWDKIFSGEQTYIEDYVNATFGAFKENKDDEDKWVLKVERDEKGKSKKIKFTSPIFSVKSKN